MTDTLREKVFAIVNAIFEQKGPEPYDLDQTITAILELIKQESNVAWLESWKQATAKEKKRIKEAIEGLAYNNGSRESPNNVVDLEELLKVIDHGLSGVPTNLT